MTMLDATVANVALPRIGSDLGAEVSDLQWVLTGYMLPLAALILLGGALGDRYGRRRVFLVGCVWFALASLLCALAPTAPLLIAARVLQGIGAALLTPGSLAIIEASLRKDERARAVGLWSGIGGLAAAVGPFVGGAVVDGPGWRWAFLLNLPLAAVVIILTVTSIPETVSTVRARHFDIIGAVLVTLGLGGLTWSLTEMGSASWAAPRVIGPGMASIALLGAFVVRQIRTSEPLVAPSMFRSRVFTTTNIATFVIYGAFATEFLFLVYQLQVTSGWSATAAGSALLPATLIMFLLSGRSGALAQRIGPRPQLIAGPLLAGAGLLLLSRIDDQVRYLTDVLPGAILMGFGFVALVPPLVATVMGSVDSDHISTASGVNNAVARTGQLLAIAIVPVATGLSVAVGPAEVSEAFRQGMVIAAGLAVTGAVINAVGLPRRRTAVGRPRRVMHCAVEGPPLEPDPDACPEMRPTSV